MSTTRRAFLKFSGAGLVALGSPIAPGLLGRLVSQAGAAESGNGKILVCLFQRGAMDGLMAVSPLNDPGLRKLRPRLAMEAGGGDEAARLLDLGNDLGLHPALAPLRPLYRSGELAVVHGIGSPNPTRSHFDAQDYMESGTPFAKGTPDGWLHRAMEVDPPGSGSGGAQKSPFRAVALTARLPRSLYGGAALAVEDLTELRLDPSLSAVELAGSSQGFEALYAQTSQEILRDAGHGSFDAVHSMGALDPGAYEPANGAEYPRTPLGRSLRQIAFLAKSDVGLRVAFAESTGWDTHVQQGTANGQFANRARDFAGSIAAFWRDLGALQDRVVLLTTTEFGRTVHENGSGGTDHGRGSVGFVLGTAVEGGASMALSRPWTRTPWKTDATCR